MSAVKREGGPQERGGDESLKRAVRALASRESLGTVASIQAIEGGSNNRVYRVRTGSRDLFLKQYFRSADDPRDRFTTEVSFARFAWERGVRTIARPLGADTATRIAAFEWIDGVRIAAGAVTQKHVGSAMDFCRALNAHRAHPQAASLAPASEACFTIAEHIAMVDRRIARLTEQAEPAARAFASERLQPAWISVRANLRTSAKAVGLDLERALAASERCLSPSDFGFHNALLTAEGRIVFYDFEYAGWDDPAKLVGDFFSQVAVPVPLELEQPFTAGIAEMLGLNEPARMRIELLRPVFRLKWACIVLNEFLPAAGRRRVFAVGETEAGGRKVEQLDKAAEVLGTLKTGR